MEIFETKSQNGGMSAVERVVRKASEEDLDAVLVIDNIAPVGHEHRELLTRRVETGECLVYAEHGVVAGYVTLGTRSFFGRDFIELLAVAPDERRRGVGRSLLRGAVDQSTTLDVFISTNRSNRPMRSLLEEEKWMFSGQLEGIDEGDPELVFYKRGG
jgi:ribosomal protein S18 acetylase RimI-like enzyme